MPGISSGPPTITGTTTAVAKLGGMPSSKSSLGSTRGGTTRVTIQCTSVTPKIEAGSSASAMPTIQATGPAPTAAR